ncbi:hypothetical protein D3C72_1523770 [compost metagenome]
MIWKIIIPCSYANRNSGTETRDGIIGNNRFIFVKDNRSTAFGFYLMEIFAKLQTVFYEAFRAVFFHHIFLVASWQIDILEGKMYLIFQDNRIKTAIVYLFVFRTDFALRIHIDNF